MASCCTNYLLHVYSVLDSFLNIRVCTFSEAAQLPCEDNRAETLIPTGASDLAKVSQPITESRGSNSQDSSSVHGRSWFGLASCLPDCLSTQQAFTPKHN